VLAIRFRRHAKVDDELLGMLYDAGTSGIIESDLEIEAFFDEGTDVSALRARFGDEIIATGAVSGATPNEFPRDDWTGISVGQKFFIAPSWVHEPTPLGRLRLSPDSVTAFGTGRHETTQLMLEFLESELQPSDCVVDVGAGSGILSAAARLLGASQMYACDIDEDVVRQARDFSGAHVFVGSVDAVRSEIADLLLVNISGHVIESLLAQMKRVIKPDGRIVLSGFIRDNPPRHVRPTDVMEKADWQCWVCSRDGIQVAASELDEVLHHSPKWW
jgi:SAM-dependent methyltransferase